MTTSEAQDVTIIFTGRSAQIIHATGCRDIARETQVGDSIETITAQSLTEVAAEVYSDFEGAEDMVGELTVKPCVHLPVRV